MDTKTVGLLKSAWDDWDELLRGVAPEELSAKEPDRSSIGWCLAHVTNQLDGWINVRFQLLEPDDLLGSSGFSIGGSGEAPDREPLLAAVDRARARAWGFLKDSSEDELGETIRYDGAIRHLRESGLPLRHAILRIAAHHYLHLGEAVSELSRRGLATPDLPGPMWTTI